jgi:hypothetical protein
MKKALAILATVATVGATVMTAPAEARGRGIGPGLAFGLAAGALTAGAIAAGGYGPITDMDQAMVTDRTMAITAIMLLLTTEAAPTPTTVGPIIAGTATGGITSDRKHW